jgi:hypothetical protein
MPTRRLFIFSSFAAAGSLSPLSAEEQPPAQTAALDEFLKLEAEGEARPITTSFVGMTDLTQRHSDLNSGSILVVLVDAKNAEYADLRQLLKSDPLAALSRLKQISDQYATRNKTDLATAVENARSAPVLSDIRIGTKTLASNVPVLGDVPVTILTFPYNGGDLPDANLTLVQKKKSPTDAVDAFAFIQRPVLTSAEVAALHKLSPSQRELNVGSASMCYAITGVTVAATVIAATGLCHHGGDEIDTHIDTDIDFDKLKKLDPPSTATELLQLRRQRLESMYK